jgi:hypothetical protein
MSEIIKEQGNYRVIIEVDPLPYEPEADCQSPLLRSDGYCGVEHIQLGGRSTEDDARIEEAADRWGVKSPLFARYLRAYHGVTQIITYWSGSYLYVTYDSAKWRQYTGAPEGSASLADYKAWCQGEVYVCEVQERVTWRAVNPVREYHNRVTWETVEKFGTFYDDDSAREEALEALENFTGAQAGSS